MATIRSVCVYCGSGNGKSPAYLKAAADFGALLAREGISLVYGGGAGGLMGEVSRSVMAHGGKVIGIIPDFLVAKEGKPDKITERHVVPDMHTRKMMMYDKADAFVALPGGIGTLEELVEQLTWAQIGRHKKPIVVLNTEGFWDPFRVLIEHMRAEGFIRAGLHVSYGLVDKVEDVLPYMREKAAHVPEGELGTAGEFTVHEKM